MRTWGNEKDSNDEIQPSKWEAYFKHLFGDNNNKQEPLTTDVIPPVPIFNKLDFSIKEEEILTALKKLKKDKAPGLDNILHEFLIAGKESLLKPLCKLFNLVFNSGTYPSIWSLNFLRPIHKKDDRKDPDNYRGIAVGSCLSKLFSYVLLNRLVKHAEKHGLVKTTRLAS